MKRLYLLSLACALLLSACSKRDDHTNTLRTLRYEQTHCADPWQRYGTGEETAKTIAQFLAGKGILISQINITSDGVRDLCKACHCRSGNLIYVSAQPAAADSLLKYGFKVVL